jgi:hypothetical protein
MDQIAQYAQGLAGQMYSWAQNTYAQTSQITNEAVNNFFNVSQQMSGLSNNLTNQYNTLFAPENAQLVADANSYASPARMAVDMGMAGATQAQAGNAALANSEEALGSYGIDPSSGRYAALDQASRVQNAANVAGAENQQRVADIQTGQALRNKAVDIGATMPAAISNVNNTAIQANAGASNAELANANTGANLLKLPNDYLGTAMQVKLPFNGQQSSGHSQSQSDQPQKSSPSGGDQSGGNGGSGSGSGSTYTMPNNTSAMGSGGGTSGQGMSLTDKVMKVAPDQFDPNAEPPITEPPVTDTGPSWPQTGPTETPQDPGGDLFGNGGGDQQWAGPSATPDYQPVSDPSLGQGDLGGYNTPDTSSSAPIDTSGTAGGGDTAWGGDSSSYDSGGGGDGSGDFSFARGGAIPDGRQAVPPHQRMMRQLSTSHLAPTYARGGAIAVDHHQTNLASGGKVDPAMSPSHGAKVDDVRAQAGKQPINLNADEFVIPKDVALWKGQEFFQKLIMDSRKARMGAPAKPTAGPPR